MGKIINISVLYVEDEAGIRESIERLLNIRIETVYTAKNGKEALELLGRHSVDLIITDIRMPEMDGLTFIEHLRKEGIELPVIITTAFDEAEYMLKAIDLKVDKFIQKPIRISTLLETVVHLSDIILQKRELFRKRQQLESYRQVLEMTTLMMHSSATGEIIDVSDDLKEYFRTNVHKHMEITKLGDLFDEATVNEIIGEIQNLKIFHRTVSMYVGNKRFTMTLTAFPSLIEHDLPSEVTVLLQDITPILEGKEQIIQKLYTDPLTGLPNRQRLFAQLEKDESVLALIIVDIDSFSRINHLYGNETGDALIKEMAKVLAESWPKEHPFCLYRSYADRFVITTPNYPAENQRLFEEIAHAIALKIDQHKFEITENIELDISVTMGMSFGVKDDLFTEASIALNAAKNSKKVFECFCNLRGIKEQFQKNLFIQKKVKRALAENGIINYYQPIVDGEGEIVKYEALVRMRDPEKEGTILTPYDFLEIAKSSKNYVHLTMNVIKNALETFQTSPYGVSINLSYEDIANPQITIYLESMLEKFSGKQITIELLESEGLKDIDLTIEFCTRMKGYGALIAIDDFGSGYSNFEYFFDIPVDFLKIDGSLIKRVNDYKGYLVVEAISNFAKRLGVKTVAEYVENREIFEKLKKLEIDLFQGYYFSPPKPFEEL